MKARSDTFAYRIFDRYLRSDIPLQLLRPQDTIPPGAPLVRIHRCDEIRQPNGEVMWEPHLLGFHMVKSAGSVLMVFPRIGWFADIDDRTFEITCYPMNADEDTFREVTLRSLGDRIVTSLLSRYPQRWGMATVHGALLSKDSLAITLLGRSGAGKSTLSQVLQREFGWRVLDDDTFGVYPDPEEKTVWGMGAYPRIREGALEFFDATGPKLPGYQGGKIFLSDPDEANNGFSHESVVLSHAFLLDPSDSDDQSPKEPASVTPLQPHSAIEPLLWSVMPLGTVDEEFARLRFHASTWLAQVPSATVSYRHFLDKPSDVALSIDHLSTIN
jgi:hypothetical protein